MGYSVLYASKKNVGFVRGMDRRGGGCLRRIYVFWYVVVWITEETEQRS